MKLIQLTDLHLTPQPEESCKGVRTHRALALLWPQVLKEEPDLVVITGDIAAREEAQEIYLALKIRLDDSGIPCLIQKGNHDRGNLLEQVFSEDASPVNRVVATSEGVLLVFFDTSPLEVVPPDLQWLQTQLTQATQPICLFTHYPSIQVNHPLFDGIYALEWKHALNEVYQCTVQDLFVFFGHIHFSFESRHGRVHHFGTASTTLPITGRHDFELDRSGLSYRVILLQQGRVITQIRRCTELSLVSCLVEND